MSASLPNWKKCVEESYHISLFFHWWERNNLCFISLWRVYLQKPSGVSIKAKTSKLWAYRHLGHPDNLYFVSKPFLISSLLPFGRGPLLNRCLMICISSQIEVQSALAIKLYLSLFITDVVLRLKIRLFFGNCLLLLECKFHECKHLYRFIIDVLLPGTSSAALCSKGHYSRDKFLIGKELELYLGGQQLGEKWTLV